MAQTNTLAGQTPQYVTPSTQTLQGLDAMYAGVANAQSALPVAQNNYNFLSQAADIQNNPYVQGMLGTNASEAQKALDISLQGLSSGAQSVNAMGSSRLGLAQGQAVGDAQTALANANNALQLGAYNSGLTAQQSALSGLGALQSSYLYPAQALASAGQQMEGYTQNAINAPWQQIQNTGSALQYTNPLGVLSGTGTGQTVANSAPQGTYDPFTMGVSAAVPAQTAAPAPGYGTTTWDPNTGGFVPYSPGGQSYNPYMNWG
jgi:hypothetical protein